ncbi:hypothetical protein [Candidatus Borrarchaeum sp.]|uniref:hypothetical protein n=1 Tax=Candidatus Borrarchaeum sp. TaxID=2846742 RepID=UPI0025796BC0|nr:hypothetical protein [Candidatus Borrarchaeum sp.]
MAQIEVSEEIKNKTPETNNFACPNWDTCTVHRCDICAFGKSLTYESVKTANEPNLAYSCETFGQYDVKNLICSRCPLKLNCMEEKEKRQAYLNSLAEMESLVGLVQKKIAESKVNLGIKL